MANGPLDDVVPSGWLSRILGMDGQPQVDPRIDAMQQFQQQQRIPVAEKPYHHLPDSTGSKKGTVRAHHRPGVFPDET